MIVLTTVFSLGAASAPASTPSSSSVVVPATAGQTVTVEWSGTIPPGANLTSSCHGFESVSDSHSISIALENGAYDTVNAAFKFTITWANASNDEILTVLDPQGEEVDSSDGGSNIETVNANNLPAGDYKALACAFASTVPVAYTGKLEVTTTSSEPEASLPSADAQGLAFSAAVAADHQRDESEPLIEIDKAGNVYDCGPTGFSNASDYAQVSTDGGDQFHLLGTPPRGQQGAGGGGDCGLALGIVKNDRGYYDYSYTGLGPLTGFVTSVSPNNGRSIATGGPFANGVTDEGGGADRQWQTFVDANTVLLIYNQQEPRNIVVQRSTDKGLTYGPDAIRAARSPRFPGPIRYIEPTSALPNGVVYFPWDRGAPTGSQINISFSTDRGATWRNCGGAVAPGTTTLFATADHDSAGNIYIVYGENVKFHTYMITTSAASLISTCTEDPTVSSKLPDMKPAAFSTPTQVDRDGIRSSVFQWVTAGGAPGRVAVVFAGTESDGNPNSGDFDATWHLYVNQSLNALSTDPASPPTFSQVQATTHPFHYDSICLDGLGCDLSVPPGDRSMADYFSLDYNVVDGKIYATFDRANKKPDEDLGHLASTMVVTQIAGPSLGGGTISSSRPVVRSVSADPTGDALSAYSILTPGVVPPDPATRNEPAGDFVSVSVGPELDLLDNSEVPDGGFTATVKVANLSTASLLDTMAQTQSQSLLWLFRFTNGYQDVAAAARFNPVQGFSFGYNEFTTGSAPCQTAGAASTEKCILYPGDQPIQGDVDQATGTIRISVPRYLLRALSGPTGPGQRPSEVAATVGSRLYDATMFSLGNTVSPDQSLQSFLYTFDNTPAMDFLLPKPTPVVSGVPCKITGSGEFTEGGKFSLNVHKTTPPKGSVAYRDSTTDFQSKSITSATCTDASRAEIRGTGTNNGEAVGFVATAVDGGKSSASDSFTLTLEPGGARGGTLSSGNVTIHRN